MAANINYDGGNQWDRTRDVTYIGYGKSSLDDVELGLACARAISENPEYRPGTPATSSRRHGSRRWRPSLATRRAQLL